MQDSDEQVANENNSLRERIVRTKAKQQYIEIETNVPINQKVKSGNYNSCNERLNNSEVFTDCNFSKTINFYFKIGD